MKRYIGILVAVVGLMNATPTQAATTYTHLAASKTVSEYVSGSFEEIGILAGAVDQDGLKLLTITRTAVTGAVSTLASQACNSAKSCAATVNFRPATSDAGRTITFTVTAKDVGGSERSQTLTVQVASIPDTDTVGPEITIDTSSSGTITIPRDQRSTEVTFTSVVGDKSGVRSVTLYRSSPIPETRTADVPWVSNFNSSNGRNCLLTSRCSQRAPITFSTADIGRTISVYAEATDFAGNTRRSNTLRFTVAQETSADRTAPTGSITVTPNEFTLSSGETGTVRISATVRDNVAIESVKLYRTNPQNSREENLSGITFTPATTGVECNTAKTLCTFTHSTLIPGVFAGYNTPYYAVIKDTAGNETRTASVNVRVNARTTTATSTTSVPTVTITPSSITMDPSATRTLSATATSNGGVYAIEIRALPSWTDTVTKKRCTLSGGPRSGSCTMDIGPFTGRSSGTIKYWAIAWDNTSGMGGNSGEKTATLSIR